MKKNNQNESLEDENVDEKTYIYHLLILYPVTSMMTDATVDYYLKNNKGGDLHED